MAGHIELYQHTAHHWGKPVAALEYTDGLYRYRASFDFDDYWNAEPSIISREEAISLWPDENGVEAVTAITEARTPITLQEFIAQLGSLPPDTVPLLDIGGQPDVFMHPYRGHNRDMAFTPDSGESPPPPA